MGLYGDFLLPRLLDLAMGTRILGEERRKVLAGARGRVLEVGFGSGHNIVAYPPGVQEVVGVDPSPRAARLARKRIARASFPVSTLPLAGERIDAPDASFDAVVSTFALCTIADPAAALAQMLRVLKPDGRFFFLEHGRADDPSVQRWQDRLNGVQKALFGGCHLNRDIVALVRAAGFELEQIDRYYLPGQPRPYAFLTRGIARRA
jgi:ubiquinone/menaquinone biosynthesis C-methylase UbiE